MFLPVAQSPFLHLPQSSATSFSNFVIDAMSSGNLCVLAHMGPTDSDSDLHPRAEGGEKKMAERREAKVRPDRNAHIIKSFLHTTKQFSASSKVKLVKARDFNT